MDDQLVGQDPGALYSQAKAAASEGRREEAHQLFSRLTAVEPRDVQAWLWRAATAATRGEELTALNAALKLDPEHEQARIAAHEALKRQLQEDPFLAYDGESGSAYRVQTADGLRVLVPKRRAVPKPYPPAGPGPLKPANRWLALSAVGLLPSGLGALIAAPIALFLALRLPTPDLSPQDRRRRRVVIVAALALWVLGLALSFLVLIHL